MATLAGPDSHHPSNPFDGHMLPILAAIVGLVVTSLLSLFVHEQTYEAASARFEAVTRDVLTRLDQRIDAYAQILRGGAGLALTHPTLDRATWAQYYRSLQIPRRFPGVQTFLWVPVLPASGVAGFERVQRGRGHPDFRVWTRGQERAETAIAFVEPFEGSNRKALGFDMFSEPVRRTAMTRARDTGEMAITERLTLVIDDRPLPAFIMYIPVYRGGEDPGEVNRRRALLAGYVASAFRVEDLLRATLSHRTADLRVRVYDGGGTGDADLLIDARSDDEPDFPFAPVHRQQAARSVGGRIWTIAFESSPAFEARVADHGAMLVAVAGLLLTALGTWATSLAVSLRRRTAVLSALTDSLGRNRADLERANAELTTARDAALAAAKAKSTFLANMSHEIRTPIHGFLGHTELALGNPIDPQTRGFLETARDCGRALLGVIDDILDFSKLEADRFELDRTDFDLRALLLECTRTVALKAHERGVALFWSADPDVPDRVSGDAKRLRQVLLNLLSNAVKFTRAGEVELSANRVDAGSGPIRVEFSVRDTGIGMTAETRGRLFQAFYQADASITREFGGTGLGLAISSRIVALMGGHLSVESEPGVGSRFRFSAGFGAAAGVSRPPRPVDRQAIVVDANPRRAEASRRLLVHAGLPCSVALSLESALAATPDRALLVIDGSLLETADARDSRVRLDARHSTVVIAGSGADRATFDRARLLGATVVARPLDPAQVLAAIDRPGPQAASSPTAQASPAARGLSVLVAEDNPVNRALVARMLERLGHRITLAEHGIEAVMRFEPGRFDVVLMDVQMPEMDGLEATRRIRALEAGRTAARTPILALTADTLPGDRERCLEAGMDGHLSKPLSLDQLRDALESVEGLAADGPSRLAG